MDILLIVYALIGVGYFVGMVKIANYPNLWDIIILAAASVFWPILLGLDIVNGQHKRRNHYG